MKTKLSLILAGIVIISAFAVYVFARGQATARGTLPPLLNAEVALCNADAVMMRKSFPSTGMLQIEMNDGSVQQIRLSDVKKLTLRDWDYNFRH